MRALLSVYDKTGLVEIATRLHDLGFELVSTGGSAATLAEAGLPVTKVADVTGFPEILDGRVKTLHPRIHGGLLARRDVPAHVETLAQHDITPIDVVVSNLYPFSEAASDPDASFQDKIELIDIGGPAMIRASAKNHGSVVILTDPADYDEALTALANGSVSLELRQRLAARAFRHVSTYDALIAQFLGDEKFPSEQAIPLAHAATPKYGENAQQQAAAYRRLRPEGPITGLLEAELLKGEPLSFNNYLDADGAWTACGLWDTPTVAIVKHMVPCGLATRATLVDAWKAALEGDPVSAYGGIVGLNRQVDAATADEMRKLKLDIIIAPGYDDDALAILKRKKGTRILQLQNYRIERDGTDLDLRPITGGLLLQEPDTQPDDESNWNVATTTTPTDSQWRDLRFAWKAVRLIKSNAIVFVRDEAIVGLGAGQPNRLESVAIAARKAGDSALGAVMASDAFFPFADGLEAAQDAGIAAVIQPGGSMRDDDVIAAADAAGLAMVLTGTRHFRH